MSQTIINQALQSWLKAPSLDTPFCIRRSKTRQEYLDNPQDRSYFSYSQLGLHELQKYASPNRIKYSLGLERDSNDDVRFVLGVPNPGENLYHHDLLDSNSLIMSAGFMQLGTLIDNTPSFMEPSPLNVLFMDGKSTRYPTVGYGISRQLWFSEDLQPTRPGGLKTAHQIFGFYLSGLQIKYDHRPRPKSD